MPNFHILSIKAKTSLMSFYRKPLKYSAFGMGIRPAGMVGTRRYMLVSMSFLNTDAFR
jgi:hypothetical protein